MRLRLTPAQYEQAAPELRKMLHDPDSYVFEHLGDWLKEVANPGLVDISRAAVSKAERLAAGVIDENQPVDSILDQPAYPPQPRLAGAEPALQTLKDRLPFATREALARWASNRFSALQLQFAQADCGADDLLEELMHDFMVRFAQLRLLDVLDAAVSRAAFRGNARWAAGDMHTRLNEKWLGRHFDHTNVRELEEALRSPGSQRKVRAALYAGGHTFTICPSIREGIKKHYPYGT